MSNQKNKQNNQIVVGKINPDLKH